MKGISDVPWHKDCSLGRHSYECCSLTVGISVTGADAESGQLRVVAGSHTRGCLPGRTGEGVLGPLFTDPGCFDETRQVALEVPAGSLVFFSPHTVHGSQPNRSDLARRAFVITYQPGGHRMFRVDAVRQAGEAGAQRAQARRARSEAEPSEAGARKARERRRAPRRLA